jgi:acetyltransferase
MVLDYEPDALHECIAARYPRDIQLPDGTTLTLTPLVPSDWEFLERFLRETPEEDRRYFRREASDPARVERWCRELDYRHNLPLLAWQGERIAADGVLQRESGLWTSHVGRVRLLVHPDFRGRGLGRRMMHELFEVARHVQLHKVVYECAAQQTGLIGFLRSLGFQEAARLKEFIRDRRGELDDMLLWVMPLARAEA